MTHAADETCIHCNDAYAVTLAGHCGECADYFERNDGEDDDGGDDTPPPPPLDGEAVWALYMQGTRTLDDALALADGIKCIDSHWELNCDPNEAAAMLIVLGDGIFEASLVEKFARRGAYHHIRKALEGLYPEASGSLTDPWIAETYSELYKDDYGVRPRGLLTGKAMRLWVWSRDAE
ncbi:hypothetical protein ACQKOE_07155 [Novosphingobium sp. NPDC080210]|uniref:hypothetical protein n=1 Tax=Novosphingobium sp. NPDC080210 TaxID=3390596 RepID=UPI003D02BC98